MSGSMPIVIGRTGAEDAWYRTFSLALGWFLDGLVGEHAAPSLGRIIAETISGRFSSWTEPDAATAREACAALGAAVASTTPTDAPDALADWLRIRQTAFAHVPAASDARGAWALALLLDQLTGPRAR